MGGRQIQRAIRERKTMKSILAATVLSLLLASGSALSQGKISGSVFADYFYNVSRDGTIDSMPNTAVGGATGLQGFQFRRIYFTYDSPLSEQFSSRFRLEADQGDLFASNKIGVVIKDAYLQWKEIFAGSNAIFGIQPTPAFSVSEDAWGYRSLEKTIMDLRGIVSSRDFGAALRGKLLSGASLEYWLMVTNGAGNKPETDKYKRYYAQLRIRPVDGVQATLYADYAAHADIADPFRPGSRVANGMTTAAFFVGYENKDKFSFGAEGFLQSISNGFNAGTSLKSRTAIGLSFWGNAALRPNVALVARFDYFDPNTDGKAIGDSRNYLIGGLAWKPDKNVSIIPNILYETYESLADGQTLDASITLRATIAYNF